jgi:hypothetical protein
MFVVFIVPFATLGLRERHRSRENSSPMRKIGLFNSMQQIQLAPHRAFPLTTGEASNMVNFKSQ